MTQDAWLYKATIDLKTMTGEVTAMTHKHNGQWLYVARVERDTLTGEVTLVPGRDRDVFEIHEGDEFITFTTPAALFGEDDE